MSFAREIPFTDDQQFSIEATFLNISTTVVRAGRKIPEVIHFFYQGLRLFK